MKKMLLVLVSVLLISFLSLFSSPASAGTQVVGPCPTYGVHRMYAQGFAVVKDYRTLANLDLGGWYKCACGERFLAEGHPDWDGPWPIYNYATEGAIKDVSVISGQSCFLVDSSLMRYTTSHTLSGYKFF